MIREVMNRCTGLSTDINSISDDIQQLQLQLPSDSTTEMMNLQMNKQYNTICRPLCGQTQAFWSADKRNGRGAVENRTA